MLYILALEPLPERYTIQWRRWFKLVLEKRGVPHRFIDGYSLTDSVETGTVLDAEGTNFWKLTQMQAVCRLFKNREVRNGDKFFSMDMWHPGLECIPYMAQLEKLSVEVYAFLHAGSYTDGDFAAPMAPWARYFEQGWFALCNKVFVGSKYHARKFASIRSDIERNAYDKLVVSGNPLDTNEIIGMAGFKRPVGQRENIIVFPHRWDKEKNPARFLKLMHALWQQRQDFKVLITTSRKSFPLYELAELPCPWSLQQGCDKEKYYQLLATAKVFVSTTVEESFGYCLAEAVTLGCSPVVEGAFSHPELLQYNAACLFHSDEQAVALLNRHLDCPIDCSMYMQRYNDVIPYMLRAMGCLAS